MGGRALAFDLFLDRIAALLSIIDDERRCAVRGKGLVGNLHGAGSICWEQPNIYRPPLRSDHIQRLRNRLQSPKWRSCLQQGKVLIQWRVLSLVKVCASTT